MHEHEQFTAPNLKTRIDRWLRHEDTWLTKGLRKINSLEGSEYRVSKTKRATDVAIALPLAALASLPTGILIVASSIQEPIGHPFYRPERRKAKTQNIKITKLRTMQMNSDCDPNLSLTHNTGHPPEDDSRNTKLGKMLRTFEFDELPQLFEVLAGKLSLIDVRSMPASGFEMAKKCRPETYEEWETAYYEGIPGVFSLNSAINKDRKHLLKRQRFDIFYAKHASLGLDLFILYRTGLRMVRKATQKLGISDGNTI